MYNWRYEYFNSDYFKATQKKRSKIYYIIFSLLAVACLFIEFTLFASPDTAKAFTQDGYVQRSYVIDTPSDFLTSTTYFYTPSNELLSSLTNPLYYISSDYDIQYTRNYIQSVGQWFSHFSCVPINNETVVSANTYLKFTLPASSLPNTNKLTVSISYFNSNDDDTGSPSNFGHDRNRFQISTIESIVNNTVTGSIQDSLWFNSTTPSYYTFTLDFYGYDVDFYLYFATDIYLGNIKVENGSSFTGFVNDNYLPNGYNVGYQEGWYNGYNSVNTQGLTFLGFLNAVVSAPLNAVLSIFDVDILGYNMKSLLASLLSISVILLVIKFILGKVGSDSD